MVVVKKYEGKVGSGYLEAWDGMLSSEGYGNVKVSSFMQNILRWEQPVILDCCRKLCGFLAMV